MLTLPETIGSTQTSGATVVLETVLDDDAEIWVDGALPLVFGSAGGPLYLTDPPFGLPRFLDDPRKELPYSGVLRYADGKLQLLTTELTGPNGLAFTLDERFLYVDNWDVKKKVVMKYPVLSDGKLGEGTVFLDMKDAPEEKALDGLKVDREGNVYVSGPGGLWMGSSEGKHVGTIRGPEVRRTSPGAMQTEGHCT